MTLTSYQLVAKNFWIRALIVALVTLPLSTHELLNAATESQDSRFVLTDEAIVRDLNLVPLFIHAKTGTVLVRVTDKEREWVTAAAHARGRCAGHELIADLDVETSLMKAKSWARSVFDGFDEQEKRDLLYQANFSHAATSVIDPAIQQAVALVSEPNIRGVVDMLSQMRSRNHRTADGRQAVLAFKNRIETLLHAEAQS